jgi:hypothetical protein
MFYLSCDSKNRLGIINHVFGIAIVAIILVCSTLVKGGVITGGNDTIQCIPDYTQYNGMEGQPFSLCLTYTYEEICEPFPSNGTELYDVKFTYTYYKNESLTSKLFDLELGRKGYNQFDPITSEMIDNTIAYVTVPNIGQCKSSKYCGGGDYSADCTNLLYGRNVQCEAMMPFFPFTGDAILSGKEITSLTSTPTTPTKPTPAKPPTPASPKTPKCFNVTLPNPIGQKPSRKNTNTSFPVCTVKNVIKTNMTTNISKESYYGNYSIYSTNNLTNGPIFTISFDTIKNFIKVDNVGKCNSFSDCNNGRFSADCTNLQYGRNVSCEFALKIFFPFTVDATKITSRNSLKL